MSDTPQTTHAEAQFDRLLHGLLDAAPVGQPFHLFMDTLGQRDRHLLLIQGLDSQVANGGFAQWIQNGYLERDLTSLNLALDRLVGSLDVLHQRRIVQVLQAMLEEVAAIAAGAGPDGLDDCDLDRLDPLDDRYYRLYGEFRSIFWQYFLLWAAA
ncbi:DMP19 family protein [Deinococcus rufus]|uniref:DUF4375 domain-containing protein n=1 Tax=Deinococcus rufus TaxID=2136097 RepID=A0ABV7Z8Y7_9DEIO